MSEELDVLLAERAVQRVLTTYSRGVDRFDFESVSSCYWPDGTDDHGSFVGGVDDFIPFVEKSLNRFERTAHVLGNVLVDVDLDRDVARAETYAVAFPPVHRPGRSPDGHVGGPALRRPVRTPGRRVADRGPGLRLRPAPHRPCRGRGRLRRGLRAGAALPRRRRLPHPGPVARSVPRGGP